MRYIEKELKFKERLMRDLLSRATAMAGAEVASSRAASPLLALARVMARDEAELQALAARHGVLAYAFVPVE